MFTGIVEAVGSVAALPPGGLVISAGPVLDGLKLGASVAVNGVCLTVTEFSQGSFTVDVMPETLRRTNLGKLRIGDAVNLERAMTLGGEMGGHLVQGHVDATGRVAAAASEGEAIIMRFEVPPEVMRYIVPKGFIAVDGISLTVMNRGASWFEVSVVGFTRQNTVLGGRRAGDTVNLEADIIAKYVEQLGKPPEGGGITMNLLEENGFLAN
jgi:riboflavin synthase